jgi:hypothetical protein
MSLYLHAAVASPLAKDALKATAMLAMLATVLLMLAGIDWFVATLALATFAGISSIGLGVLSVLLRSIAAVREWRQR